MSQPKVRLISEGAKQKSLPRKLNFTVKALGAIQPPPSGRVYYYDTKTPGLALCVTSKGATTFYVCRRINGQPERVLIGPYPPTTIEQARKSAINIHNKIVDGKDPQAERRQARGEMTLAQLWADYQEKHAKVHSSAKTIRSDEARWTNCLADLATRRLSTIKKADVVILHAKLGQEKGKTNANRAVQLVRRLYNFAMDKLELEITNPAMKITMFPEAERERFLEEDELPRFFAALEQEPEIFRDFFAVSLWTGARRSNVQAMAWDHLDLETAIWRIPGDESKNDKGMAVPLSPEALAILRRRQEANVIGSPWVFASHGESGHLVEPKTAWKRICKRAKLKNLRIHDLRRTLGSWQAAGGSSLVVIGKSLGHLDPNTTKIYARMNLDPVRASVNAATAAMAAAGKAASNGQ